MTPSDKVSEEINENTASQQSVDTVASPASLQTQQTTPPQSPQRAAPGPIFATPLRAAPAAEYVYETPDQPIVRAARPPSLLRRAPLRQALNFNDGDDESVGFHTPPRGRRLDFGGQRGAPTIEIQLLAGRNLRDCCEESVVEDFLNKRRDDDSDDEENCQYNTPKRRRLQY
jgi:hypothetical protein